MDLTLQAIDTASADESNEPPAKVELPEESEPAENQVGPGQFPGVRKPLQSLWWLFQVVLGVGFLLPLLAGFAAFPGLNVISLGMMLDAEAKVGRSGRIRDGFPLLAISTRVGTIGLMVLLCLIPVMAASSVAQSQIVIKQLSGLLPGRLLMLQVALQFVAFTYLILAIANGGSFGRFLWPIRETSTRTTKRLFGVGSFLLLLLGFAQPGFWLIYILLLQIGASWRNARDLSASLKSGRFKESANYWTEQILDLFQPWHHFKLALKGAIGALCWLVLPTLLLGTASSEPHENQAAAGALSFLGGVLLIPVAAWLPLLQCHQAATGRFKAIFEVRTAREIICRVPVRWAISTILLYGLAVPLYLSKVVVPPADAFWLFTPLFILVIYPTRILMGWVYSTGMQRDVRMTRLVRWPTKLFMIPLLGLYGLILFALPLISEAGPQAMLENHAFLLPVPGQFQ